VLKIDLHTHILPERWPDWTLRSGYPGWIELEHHKPCCARMLKTEPDGGRTFFREVASNCWNPVERLRECDERMGVESVQVLSTVPVMFSYWAKAGDALDLARLLNDHVAGVCEAAPVVEGCGGWKLPGGQHGKVPRKSGEDGETGGTPAPRDVLRRFMGLGTVPMQAPDLAIRELERCVKPRNQGGLGLSGVQIGTNVNGKNLDDPGVFAVLEAASALGASVFVHPWEMLGRERMPKYWLPWLVGMPAETCLAVCSVIFGGVLERLPNLRMCFAHGGGSFPATIGRIQHGFEARPDLCAVQNAVEPRAYVRGKGGPAKFYVDSLVHDPVALRLLLEVMGAERIALGSDYPFPLGEDVPGAMIESMAELSEQVRRRLLHETAIEFLGCLRCVPGA